MPQRRMLPNALYLLNSPVLTGYGQWRFSGPVSLPQARALLTQAPFISAVGHAATARWLTQLLGLPVACQRVAVQLQPGDRALVYRLLQRQPEGLLLDDQAVAGQPAEFGLLERLPD